MVTIQFKSSGKYVYNVDGYRKEISNTNSDFMQAYSTIKRTSVMIKIQDLDVEMNICK